mgnify:CR=1 FL=1
MCHSTLCHRKHGLVFTTTHLYYSSMCETWLQEAGTILCSRAHQSWRLPARPSIPLLDSRYFSCIPPWTPLCFATPMTPSPTTTTCAINNMGGIRGWPNPWLTFAPCKGYPTSDATWELSTNLQNTPKVVNDFQHRYPHKPAISLGRRRRRGIMSRFKLLTLPCCWETSSTSAGSAEQAKDRIGWDRSVRPGT